MWLCWCPTVRFAINPLAWRRGIWKPMALPPLFWGVQKILLSTVGCRALYLVIFPWAMGLENPMTWARKTTPWNWVLACWNMPLLPVRPYKIRNVGATTLRGSRITVIRNVIVRRNYAPSGQKMITLKRLLKPSVMPLYRRLGPDSQIAL